jgi:hypothetical protein
MIVKGIVEAPVLATVAIARAAMARVGREHP